jgi:hypothetical protein
MVLVVSGASAARAKTVRSLQVQMFLFVLVLALSEVPRILGTLSVIQISGIQDIGLEIHTFSMFVLSAFVLLQVYKFFKS